MREGLAPLYPIDPASKQADSIYARYNRAEGEPMATKSEMGNQDMFADNLMPRSLRIDIPLRGVSASTLPASREMRELRAAQQ